MSFIKVVLKTKEISILWMWLKEKLIRALFIFRIYNYTLERRRVI